MTQISSYYASVGVKVDNSALKNVDSFLAAIKKQLKSFQETVSKSHSLKVKMMLDNQGLTKKFREVVKSLGDRNSVRVKTSLDTSGLASTLKAFSAKSSIRISDFKVNRTKLREALSSQTITQQKPVQSGKGIPDKLKEAISSQTVIRQKPSISEKGLSDSAKDSFKILGKENNVKIKASLDTSGFSAKLKEFFKTVGKDNNFKIRATLDTRGLTAKLKELSTKSFIRISDVRISKNAVNKALNAKPVQQQQSLKGSLSSVTLSNFKVNKGALNKAVKDTPIGPILLRTFSVDRKAIQNAVNNALGGNAGQGGRTSLRLGARLSQDSITAMREQVRQGLSNITIRPGVNARVSSSQRSSGGGGSSSSGSGKGGWSPFSHSFGPKGINPFVFGGLAGGMIRYGAFALPGVAGVLGLNTLSNTAMEMQSQKMALSMTAGDGVGADGGIRNGDHYYDYLDKLGARVGKRTTDLMPDFTQMLAASRGTALEGQLEDSFAGLVQYGSVMGLSEDQMKRSTRAFSQMVSKQQVMA